MTMVRIVRCSWSASVRGHASWIGFFLFLKFCLSCYVDRVILAPHTPYINQNLIKKTPSKKHLLISRSSPRLVFLMSSPSLPVLQQLLRLDSSSSDFQDQLSNLLHGGEYRQCVPELQDDDVAWLVDYLDKVRCHVVIPHFPPKQS